MSNIPTYIVRITGVTSQGKDFNGTGFLIDNRGHVATCRHVVIHEGQRAKNIRVYVLAYQQPWLYNVLDSSNDADVALLESVVPPSSETPHVTLHPNWHQAAFIGQEVIAYGHSSANNYPAGQQFPCTITGFSEKDGRVGISGSINSGDSGGPVIDKGGKVIGIVNAKDRIREGQARFVPISFLTDLIRKNNFDVRTESNQQSYSTADKRNQDVYSTADIRKLITGALTDEELNSFCLDYFPSVYEQFAAGMSKAQKVLRLTEYCLRRKQFPRLLELLRAQNPAAFTD